MKLTWLGHACFLLEEDGYRIVLDPYTGVAGYPPLHIQAHAVFCSHGHFDHHATDCVELLPERESPFTVREVETFHDDRGGALRGTNTIRIFTAGGLSAVHLGDLGHQLTAEQAAAIGRWTPCWCRSGVFTQWMPPEQRRCAMRCILAAWCPCTTTTRPTA